jgi:hypothetical protein
MTRMPWRTRGAPESSKLVLQALDLLETDGRECRLYDIKSVNVLEQLHRSPGAHELETH